MGLRASINSLKARIRGRKKPESQPQFIPPFILTEKVLQRMVNELKVERIRRAIMLFDIRWLKEDNTSYIPEEEQIAQEAYSILVRAVTHGRILGLAEIRDKGFISTYGRLNNGSEFVNIRYVLSEASSLG